MTRGIFALTRRCINTITTPSHRTFFTQARTMADLKTKQPEWVKPKGEEEPVLRVYNSLTRTKTEFVPMHGRLVKWYNCGPTVYEASHMGHARNYVTQDILRRILVDYFGYDVHFVMNITDIDDKIIIGSRQNYLLSQLRTSSPALTASLLAQTRAAWLSYRQSKLKAVPEQQEEKYWPEIYAQFQSKEAWVEGDEKVPMHVAALQSAYVAIQAAGKALETGDASSEQALALINGAKDVLALHLDALHGHTVTSPLISRTHAAHWETSFLHDMSLLRVLPPDTLTRVTEYVPEVTAFVERLIERGYAYEAGGSVWFDTGRYDGAEGKGEGGVEEEWRHAYAKLQPWSKGNRELLDDGEGALTSTNGQRSPSDFALWKASKPGEPSWPSPWGPGRPGWHIECSVMASDVLGEQMDIHSGGIDLAFPHHDNEMAQSEAYHECRQWVNYFLHTGHLHIEGLKMSKSLKNFITIEDALRMHTARQLRLAFLMQPWNGRMDYKEALMVAARGIESQINNFFSVVKALVSESLATPPSLSSTHTYTSPEKDLTAQLHHAQHVFRLALCDSFDTPTALSTLVDLISKTNVYLARGRGKVDVRVVEGVARWVTRMVRMWGLGEGAAAGPGGGLGWGEVESEGSGAVDREAVLMPYIRALSTFRDGVRQLAIGQAPPKEILALCDRLRDVDMVPLGVALDDQEDGRALVKLVSPESLIRARQEKDALAAQKASKKAKAAEEEQLKRKAKLEKGKVAPQDLFRPQNVPEGTYGSWNEEGLPLTDGQGVELTKSKSKNLRKEWDIQKKLHAEWMKYVEEQGQVP